MQRSHTRPSPAPLLAVAALLGAALVAIPPAGAQQPAEAAPEEAAEAAPRGQTQRPRDLEPAVDTSAPSAPDEAAARRPAGDPEPAAARATQRARGDDAPPPAAAPQSTTPRAVAAGRRSAGTVDRLELEATQITGNRELPKVLYIVPWRRSDLGDLVGRPVNSLLDEVLMPVDRDVFRRENRYYEALRPDEPAGARTGGGQAAGPEK